MGTRKRKAVEGRGDSVANGAGDSRSSGIIEAANTLSQDEFEHRYWDVGHDDLTQGAWKPEIFYADHLPEPTIQACFNLIEKTSRHDYEPSSFGWHPKRKLREMKEKGMRYILMRDESLATEANGNKGFLSFMLTHDSVPAVPVLYVYEIHLDASSRGKGVGGAAMRIVERIARKVGVQKVMLTCFKSNQRARAFYEALGYAVDVSSPEDRTTRKKVIKADYVIMSKDVLQQPNDEI